MAAVRDTHDPAARGGLHMVNKAILTEILLPFSRKLRLFIYI